MQMTNGEIIRSYKEAKHKGEQIKILAELNCCSKDHIMGILRMEGFNINNRIFNGGNFKASTSSKAPEKKVSDKVDKVDTVDKVPEQVDKVTDTVEKVSDKATESVEKVPEDISQNMPEDDIKIYERPDDKLVIPQSVLTLLYDESFKIDQQIAELTAKQKEILDFASRIQAM